MLKLTTLPRIFMRVVCRFNSVAFAAQRKLVLTYLPVLLFHIIIGSNVRFYADDFHRADVGL